MPITSPDDVPIRPDGLQIDEDRGFQHRFWRAERIAWAAFAAVMLVALSGLFGGSGPLNQRALRFDTAELGLPRILRAGRATEALLAFHVPGPHEVAASCAATAQGLIVETPGEGWDGGCGSAVVDPAGEGGPARLLLRLTARNAGFARLSLSVDGAERDAAFIILP